MLRSVIVLLVTLVVLNLLQPWLRRMGLGRLPGDLPEALRLVPGVEVARIGSSRWAVSARGFNSRFANKLLVLVDGRSVYSPMFSGVLWEAERVPLDNIERIEVLKGPQGALYGRNAIGGAINDLSGVSQGFAPRGAPS